MKCIEDEIPFELPEGWAWCHYSDVIELYSGQDLTPDRYNDTGEGIPYITGASNLEHGKVIINRWTITPTTHATIGDLLLTVKGSGVGKMAFCDIIDAHIARQIMALRCTSAITPQYLYIAISAMLSNITAQANGIIPGIRREIVLGAYLPLPPRSEQEKICKIADSTLHIIDDIDTNKGDLKKIIQITKSKILDLAIRGKLVPQDPDDESASVLLERIRAEKEELIKQGKIKRDKKESVIFKGEDNSYYEKIGDKIENIDDEIPFDLPDSWSWCRGYSCFEGVKSTKPQGEFFDYIDIDAIDNRLHRIKASKHLLVSDAPSRANREVKIGSVLFSLVRPYLENIALVEEKHSHCIASTGFYVCNSNGVFLPEFMFYLMISGYVVGGLNRYMKGDNSPSINKDNIEGWLYPIPPIEEQKKIFTKLQTVFAMIESVEKGLN
ncbi:restriction endonuclease subunit S [Mediterraneibacter gnavus]|uniref:restriction endonuclease subunit S n=1 Tax=Mediterraneibacter gnavus TaxID=33038 RepID=UPI00156DF2EA|nr:restriction endonuclease subunit S [Mediterraneibacter gnavus]NSI26863.1 restriction endonuclease subunit S [Mediterraneibacter gnavus]NSI49696.1 restriction endonuclease subunit S [Mediterraneibacter gnavus]